jgi:hypothetical protein
MRNCIAIARQIGLTAGACPANFPGPLVGTLIEIAEDYP